MEDNSAKRSKNFSKQELEVLVEEEEFKEGWTLWTTAVCSCYSRHKRLDLQQPKLLYPLKTLCPPHIDLKFNKIILKKILLCHNSFQSPSSSPHQ
ncbi:unnamed protein product [Gadus morhua 'NCC']